MGLQVFRTKPGRERDDLRLRRIDRQHTHLYSLVQEFNAALRADRDRERLLVILDEVIERTQQHFAAEEGMLLDLEHPSYRFQKSTHRLIIDELNLFRRLLKSKQPIRREQCIHAMDSLLVHHIKDEPPFFAQRSGRFSPKPVAVI